MQIFWQKKHDTPKNAKCQYSCIIKEQVRVMKDEFGQLNQNLQCSVDKMTLCFVVRASTSL